MDSTCTSLQGTNANLTAAELVEYRLNGLVRPAMRFDEAAVSEMRELLDLTLIATAGQRPESLVCPHIKGMNGLPGEISRRWLDIATHAQLVDVVEQVLGPDIILWGSQIFCKPAGTGLAVPWHQDGHFWPIHPLATCTTWIAIDDVTAENGGMRYIPGSHQERRLFEHEPSAKEEMPLNAQLCSQYLDLSNVCTDELRAGEFSLHDIYLVHGSEPNHSARRRAGFVLRFMPATSHYDRIGARQGSNLIDTKLADRPIFLLRGEDRTDKSNLVDLRDRVHSSQFAPND